jgi:hypothetical protein
MEESEWVSSNQLKALREKTEILGKERHSASRMPSDSTQLQYQLLQNFQPAGLHADFRILGPHNPISRFLQ